MSWSFRTFAFSLVLVWVLAPQLACFMPSQPVMPSEMDCCKGMVSDCNRANMSQACCEAEVRTDVGIATTAIRNLIPSISTAEDWEDALAALRGDGFHQLFIRNSHAPPPEPIVSSTILRI